MIQEYITKIEQSIQCVLCYLLNLCFQPVYCLLSIIQGIIDIWDIENIIDPEEEPQQSQYTVYPSANEGKYAEDCDLPACDEEHRIGFRINREEQDEINEIKRQLNK